jgi:HEAT repeat protein
MSGSEDPGDLVARAHHAPETVGRAEVSALVEDLDADGDPDRVEAVAVAVDHAPSVGVAAVPTLVDGLDADAERLREASLSALVSISRERPKAVAPAVDRLVECLAAGEDERGCADAGLVLSRVASVEPRPVSERAGSLLEALESDSPAVRSTVARTVAELAETAPEAVAGGIPDLVAALHAPVDGLRVDAARGIAAVAEGDATAVAGSIEALVEGLSDSNPAVRTELMRSLASVGMADPGRVAPWTETLARYLGDDAAAVGDAAVEALLGAAVPDPEGTAELLARTLTEGERERANAERTLRGIAMRNPTPVVDAVAPSIDHPEVGVRRSVTGLLAAVAKHRPARIEGVEADLVERLEDPDEAVAASAAEAVAAAASENPSSFEGLTQEVVRAARNDETTASLVPALAALCETDPDAVDLAALPVQSLTEHEDPAVRAGTCEVLGVVGDREALSTLRERSEDDDRTVRMAALGAMAAVAERTGATLSDDERDRIAEAGVDDVDRDEQ